MTVVAMLVAIYLLYTFVVGPLLAHFVKVVHVVDSDTILVKDGNKIFQVQLIGVDAPEQYQCFGPESAEMTSTLLKNPEVRLVKDDQVGDRDPGGRYLRYAYLKNGDFLNEKIVQNGYAKQYYDPKKKYQKQDQLFKAQNDAKAKKIGFWSGKWCN